MDNAQVIQELRDLNSSLADLARLETYSVPAMYFEDFPALMLNRIRVMETGTAAEELELISPLLSGLSKKLPFTVPTGYFSSIANNLADTSALPEFELTAAAELESI